MDISQDTYTVVEFLDEFSQGSLRKKNDMQVILELASASFNTEVVTHLSFHGSSVWRIFSVMRKTQPGSESFVKLEQEFSSSLNEIRVGLLALLDNADPDISQRFHDIYLGMSGGVARNLTDLAHDLSRFKELQNAGKRGDLGGL